VGPAAPRHETIEGNDVAEERPEVDVQGAEALLAGGAFLLDVREDDEWAAGHAPGAVHVPLGQLEAGLDQLPRDRTIVCICRSGARSGRATDALRGLGYDIVNLAGGSQAWAASGRPFVTDAGAPGRVA
jgi:rhodanese-related sulfurtransferase